jgi:hypothetical protein
MGKLLKIIGLVAFTLGCLFFTGTWKMDDTVENPYTTDPRYPRVYNAPNAQRKNFAVINSGFITIFGIGLAILGSVEESNERFRKSS